MVKSCAKCRVPKVTEVGFGNVALGRMKDDPLLLERAATYIRLHSKEIECRS